VNCRDKWKSLPLGRAISSSLFACLFVVCKLLTPKQAFDAINVDTLALLFGCMIISGIMEKHGCYIILETLISKGSPTPLYLLARISLVAGISSAFITNDSSCIVLTPLILRLCSSMKLNPMPYLLMLSTSANIGSAFSPIGNPQNMLISLLGNLFFVDFIKGILIATLFSLVINFAVIVFVYRSEVLQTTSGASQLVDEVVGGGREGEGEEKTKTITGQKEEVVEGQKEESIDIVMVSETTTTTSSSVTTSSSSASSLPLSTVESSTTTTTSSSSSSSSIPLKRKIIFGILAVLPILLISADSFMGLPWTVTLDCF
jgi:hypothetical protein